MGEDMTKEQSLNYFAVAIFGVCLLLSFTVLMAIWFKKTPDDPVYWIRILKNGTTQERLVAIGILSAVEPKSSEIIEALCSATNDKNIDIRLQAVGALDTCWRKWPLAKTALLRARNDTNEEVRMLATAVIQGKINRHENTSCPTTSALEFGN